MSVTYNRNPRFANKIKGELRGEGSYHEFLMVAEAPHWKKWDVTAQQVKSDFAIAISALNEGGVARGWRHSTGVKGSRAPNSTTVHNELRAVIRRSENLSQFRKNIQPWANRWLSKGTDSLPSGFR